MAARETWPRCGRLTYAGGMAAERALWSLDL